jgi:NAD(P)-dependent dehydrogenase (short-subunit alcohol dehydrogenase family)
MDLGIRGKTALVTGASRGIGRGIAKFLAQEGAHVVLVARTQAALDSLIKEIAADTGSTGHLAFALDLMEPDAIDTLFERLESVGRLPEIVVHNLGGSFGIPAFSQRNDWKKVWDFNVGIVHDINLKILPIMRSKKWGRIVCLSTLSTRTYSGYAPYVSAKCALDGYVKAVNREVSRDNVIISAVAPGAIYSEGRHFAKLQKENPAQLEDYFKNHLPIWRLGTADDIAPMVAFLCSQYAGFMAGSIVGIDGGAL